MRRRGEKIEIEVACKTVLEDVAIGDSICTDGVCLTVTAFSEDRFRADMMTVTAQKSGLDRLAPGASVNLERALLPTTRMGGHILQGHVDTVGTVAGISPHEGGYLLSVKVDRDWFPYFVAQGSVGLNGVSLTVARTDADGFTVSLIPETLREANLGTLERGSPITVEFDIVGKYILRAKECHTKGGGIDMDFLRRNGF